MPNKKCPVCGSEAEIVLNQFCWFQVGCKCITCLVRGPSRATEPKAWEAWDDLEASLRSPSLK